MKQCWPEYRCYAAPVETPSTDDANGCLCFLSYVKSVQGASQDITIEYVHLSVPGSYISKTKWQAVSIEE